MAGKVRYLLDRGGRYFARLIVPNDLRESIGKTEIRMPLGPDRKEALYALPRAVAQLQETLAVARKALGTGTPARSLLSIAEIAHLHYQEETELDAGLRKVDPAKKINIPRHNEIYSEEYRKNIVKILNGTASVDLMGATIGWAIDKFKDRGNTFVKRGTPEWRDLARNLAGVQREIMDRSRERDQGDFSGTPTLAVLKQPNPSLIFVDPVSIDGLFRDYIAELKRSGRGLEAEKRWKPVIAKLTAFLKHDDAKRLTRSDLRRWKDHLDTTLAASTIKKAHFASINTILNWAVENERIEQNPAENIKIRATRKIKTREQGFTHDEAKAVLSAASHYQPPISHNPRTREGAPMTAAKRWIPWLCAHTGARVAEIAQARKEDICKEGEILYLRITPDAGSTKTGAYRDVPLHPQLIELGFYAFVQGSNDGPLFYVASKDRKGTEHPSKAVSKRVGTWVRNLNVRG